MLQVKQQQTEVQLQDLSQQVTNTNHVDMTNANFTAMAEALNANALVMYKFEQLNGNEFEKIKEELEIQKEIVVGLIRKDFELSEQFHNIQNQQ